MTRDEILAGLSDVLDADASYGDDPIQESMSDAAELADRVVSMDRFDVMQAEHACNAFDYLTERRDQHGDGAIADYFAMAYKHDPSLHEHVVPEIQFRRDFLAAMRNDPEYQSLHQATMFQTEQSALASVVFADKAAAAEPQRPQDPPGRDGKPDEAAGDRMRAAHARRAARAAVNEAAQQVEQFNEGVRACGNDPANLGPTDAKRAIALYQKVRNSPKLRRIMELAGRWRLMAAAQQRQKVQHGRDEIVGVECGADLSSLLPTEFARLGHKALRLDFMRRFAERALFQWEMHAEERVGRGPIVICLDESGSMTGENECNAKALSLAMLQIARRQRRSVVCIGFSSHGCTRCFEFKGGNADPDALAKWLGDMLGGGTDFETPLTEARRCIESGGMRKADVIFITDGIASVSSEFTTAFAEFRKRLAVQCIGLLVGGSEAGPLPYLCDRVHTVRNLSTDTDAARDAVSI